MNKYAIAFSKEGYASLSSHLDLLRLFKRAFRRGGIEIAYSNGFNPHPKMGFCQPLSLGYEALGEILEFECPEALEPVKTLESLNESLPEGIKALGLGKLPENRKSAAAMVESADYEIRIPVSRYREDWKKIAGFYMAQDEIVAMKKQKKTGKMKETDIRGRIYELKSSQSAGGKSGNSGSKSDMLVLKAKLALGSKENLSPELLISTFLKFAHLNIPRHRIEVKRLSMNFPVDYEIEWM